MRNKFLTTITVAVCLAAGVAQPLRAQEPGRFPRPAPAPRSGARFALAPDPAQQVPVGQHPPQALEDLRGELLSLADSVQEFAGLAPAELVDTDSLQQARVQIQQMPAQSLNTLRRAIDPAKLHDRLLRARDTSLVCIPLDIIWIAAKAVDEGIHFCDDDLTGAVVDANYARLNHIHDDLANVQTGVNTVTTDVSNVSTQVSNVGVQISNVDTHISAVDAHITTLIAGLSAQLTTLQASVDLANQRLLKTIAGQAQTMKLELTPDGSRILVPSILSCTGSNCPNVLALCPGGVCAWNSVGPLP